MPEKDTNKASDSAVPPPLDPFPTYQTPYPRSNKDDDNPFIQFRRFADEQISSFFQGIPQLFGFLSGRDPWKKDFEDLIRRSSELEEGWRKQFEQEMEEMKQEFERSRAAAWNGLEDAVKAPKDNTPWWTRGNAANCPALNREGSDSAKRCHALYDEGGRPKTELDAYDGPQASEAATEIPVIKSSSRKTANKPFDSWFSSFGWDGKQREQGYDTDDLKATSVASSSEGRQLARPSTYTLFGARWMDPFDNTDHTIPWLLLSPYSPVYLSNPSQSKLFKVRIHVSEGEPFRISRPRFFERWYTDIDEKMANQLPWADAFEDLLSLQQTGKMVERDSPTWRTPSDWIHGLAHRGSLGPAWGFNQEGLLFKRFSDIKSKETHPSGKARCGWRKGPELLGKGGEEAEASKQQSSSGAAEDTPEGILDDFVDKAAERLGPFPLFGSILSAADSIVSAVDQATKDIEAALTEEQPESQARPESTSTGKSVTTQSHSTSSSSITAQENTSASPILEEHTAPSNSIISTLTTTATRTLPDGSVETTRVLKRRFADGTEETNESVEVKNLPDVRRKRDVETLVDKQTQTLPTKDDRAQSQPDGPGSASAQDAIVPQPSSTSGHSAENDDKHGRSRRGGWFWT